MIEAAGGEAMLARTGEASRRLEWSEIAGAEPDVVVFMPCGYDLDATITEGRALLDRAELGDASVWASDANALFSRPGPRLVDGVEALAAALHGDASEPRFARSIVQLR